MGCTIEGLLEVAHIIPFIGEESNHPANGLLLRADVHTLFELGLLSIDPEKFRVAISPRLRSTEYADLAGRMPIVPYDVRFWPSLDALQHHFDWSGLGHSC